MKQVYVVSGPPGSGKSTYVQERATGKDLIVDLDHIAQALRGGPLYGDNSSVLDTVLDLRQTLYEGILARKGKWETAYVITTGKNAAEVAQQLRGSLIQMDTSKEMCRSRILADDRRTNKDLYLSLIEDWFSDMEGYRRAPGVTGAPATGIAAPATKGAAGKGERMKREFLKELDLGEGAHLPDAAVDAIMAEYGKTTNPLKESVTALEKERDSLLSRLEAAQAWEKKYNDELPQLTAQRDALQKDIDTRNARDKVSAETGVPASLLTGDTEEACKKQADAIMQWHGAQAKYPDAAGVSGEPQETGGGTTREQFAQWASAAMTN